MTEITDDEAAGVLRASSGQGKAGRDAGPAGDDEAPGWHEHHWQIRGTQEFPPLWPGPFGKPMPRTAVLAVCGSCGQPATWLLDGTWTLEDLTRDAEPPGAPAAPEG